MTTTAPNISHYRPAVLVAAGIAAAASIVLLYSSIRDQDDLQNSNLHRRNAVRRRTRTSADAGNQTAESTIADSSAAIDGDSLQISNLSHLAETGLEDGLATEASFGAEDDQIDEEGQKLRELMFAISKNRAKNEGTIHRGVTCDNCGRVPIHGIRYHCTNCPDFDLCEDCEAQECHLKTHIFYKIRVPASWGGKHPTPVWYPGRPQDMPPELDQNIKKMMSEKTKYKSNRIDGFYQQFACLANQQLDNDPCKIGMGIDKTAFSCCFVAQDANRLHPYPNLVHDRLFAFFDEDKDGLIGFEDFVMGMVLAHSKDKEERKKRIFQCFDLNDDGYISRNDLLRFFRATYVLNKNIMVEYLRADRNGEQAERVNERIAARDFISSGRPLSSYFGQGAPEFGVPYRVISRKSRDVNGDLVPDDLDVSAVEENGEKRDLISRQMAISNMWIDPSDLLEQDVCRSIEQMNTLWVDASDIRVFDKSVHPSRRNDRQDLMIRPSSPEIIEDNETIWVTFRQHALRVGCLRLTPSDIKDVLGKDNQKWEDAKNDPRQLRHLIAAARDRICQAIYPKLEAKGIQNLEERVKSARFYLEEEEDVGSIADHRLQHSYLDYISDDDETDDLSDNHDEEPKVEQATTAFEPSFQTEDHVSKGKRSSHLVSTSSGRPLGGTDKGLIQQLPKYLGDSPAAQTIYNVTQQALNELLDPVFKSAELSGLEAEAGRELRMQQQAKIETLDRQRQFQEDPGQQDLRQQWQPSIDWAISTITFSYDMDVTNAAHDIYFNLLETQQGNHLPDHFRAIERRLLKILALRIQNGWAKGAARCLTSLAPALTIFRLKKDLPPVPAPRHGSNKLNTPIPPSTSATFVKLDDGEADTIRAMEATFHYLKMSQTANKSFTEFNFPGPAAFDSLTSTRRNGNFAYNAHFTPFLSSADSSGQSGGFLQPQSVSEGANSPQTRAGDNSGAMTLKEYFELERLERLGLQDQISQRRGGLGRLTFAEFSHRLESADSEGKKLLKWMESWLDMVMF